MLILDSGSAKSLNYKVLGRKISRFEEYKIATTMIKSQIVNNAIKIWQFLDEVQVSSVFEIEKRLQMQRQLNRINLKLC